MSLDHAAYVTQTWVGVGTPSVDAESGLSE